MITVFLIFIQSHRSRKTMVNKKNANSREWTQPTHRIHFAIIVLAYSNAPSKGIYLLDTYLLKYHRPLFCSNIFDVLHLTVLELAQPIFGFEAEFSHWAFKKSAEFAIL